jgi:hypothetical protein
MLSTIYSKSEGQPLGLIPLIADLFDQVKVFSALPMRQQFPMNAKTPRFLRVGQCWRVTMFFSRAKLTIHCC